MASGHSPKRYLLGWPPILDALGIPDTRAERQQARRFVRLFNDRCRGPVRFGPRGSRPFADRARLLGWWGRLDRLYAMHLARLREAR
jgi:hypothetical protein